MDLDSQSKGVETRHGCEEGVIDFLIGLERLEGVVEEDCEGEFGDQCGIEGRKWKAIGIANPCVELVDGLEVAGEDSDVDLCFVVREAQTCLANFLV